MLLEGNICPFYGRRDSPCCCGLAGVVLPALFLRSLDNLSADALGLYSLLESSLVLWSALDILSPHTSKVGTQKRHCRPMSLCDGTSVASKRMLRVMTYCQEGSVVCPAN